VEWCKQKAENEIALKEFQGDSKVEFARFVNVTALLACAEYASS
jgi:hypothetical protein